LKLASACTAQTDQRTTINQHIAARKKQKHQQWQPYRIQFVFVKGFMEQH
jgi:hypothetical protein